ncbi:hypothetical protein A6J73_07580 [Enterococcus hirae]|nr:hypothetical protein A6J73_07580 [Enterococcus hirae]
MFSFCSLTSFATIISFVALFNSFIPKKPKEFPNIRKRVSDFFDIQAEGTKEIKTENSLIDFVLNFFGLEHKVVNQTRKDHQ